MATKITLRAHSEKLAPTNSYAPQIPLLYHQLRTVEELQRVPLVMNTYNTGTGKTRASLLHLIDMPHDGESHVLFIAPTNELLHQHANDIRAFVAEHNLPFHILEVNAGQLRKLAAPDVVDRQSERLTRLLRNPREYAAQVGLAREDQRKLNLILVVNPDLFYYAFYWQFAAADQRNLFQAMVTTFRYIVIDEFHYYNSKQLANFLLFMILSREFEYFEAGERKLCLLSATPDTQTRLYLDRIFGESGWAWIGPENEPPESQKFASIPVLAPLHVTIMSGYIDSYAREQANTLRQWILDGKDGALISGALWRVNSAYAALRHTIGELQVGRITGAQPPDERRKDQYKPLILATPTVDIGYNFLKHDKNRQNLDFVVLDARFQDELIQRLGRTGRVLGKPEFDIPSQAVALLNDEAAMMVAQLDGCELTRAEFNAFLREQAPIPQKDDFSVYLHAGGMLENAYPLWRAREMFARTDEIVLQKAFDAVKDVFAPDSRWSYGGMTKYWSRARDIQRCAAQPTEIKRATSSRLMAEFLGWSMSQEVSTSELEENIPDLLDNRSVTDGFRTWCKMEDALARAHFSFRDSFSGPSACVFDPSRLLSSAKVTEYDLIHIAENYSFEVLDREIFQARSNEKPADNAICVQIKEHREERLRVRLEWHPPVLFAAGWNLADFERCFVAGDPVALFGVRLGADLPLPYELRTALERAYVPALLVPAHIEGALLRVTRTRGVYSRDIHVILNGYERKYASVLGTYALLVAPLLKWAFVQNQRQRVSAIIC